MKTVLFFTATIFSFQLEAQLKVDAGSDLYLCSQSYLAPINASRGYIELGGKPTATGGVAPYQYKWKYLKDSAKTYLIITSDTIPNPRIKSEDLPQYTFQLKVTDTIGNISLDTIVVYFSKWICAAGEQYMTKNKYDTVYISASGCQSIFPHIKCTWSPTTYLLDSTKCVARTYTPVQMRYDYVITDSIGCQMPVYKWVTISNASIDEPRINDIFSRFENPVTDQSVIIPNNLHTKTSLTIYNLVGEKVMEEELKDPIMIGAILKTRGVYTAIIQSQNAPLFVFKILRE